MSSRVSGMPYCLIIRAVLVEGSAQCDMMMSGSGFTASLYLQMRTSRPSVDANRKCLVSADEVFVYIY